MLLKKGLKQLLYIKSLPKDKLIILQAESDAISSHSQSDTEETITNSIAPVIENQMEIVKNEIEMKEEQPTEDIFGNDIILPRPNPVIKERRESKEKSKKELEEEEREKMQYVFNHICI